MCHGDSRDVQVLSQLACELTCLAVQRYVRCRADPHGRGGAFASEGLTG